MHILGISCYYHDSSACLLKDGRIVAAAAEERFTRKKHDNSFPINAIRFCLESEGITSADLDYVGFYEKPFIKFERVLYQHIQTFPRSLKTFVTSMPSWLTEKLRVVRKVRKSIGYRGNVLFVEHHMAHAASSYLISPFKKAAVLTVDGVGEWTTTAYGTAEGNDIALFREIRFPHSVGLLYSTITAYLGFKVNNSEYKVMGLSAYGDMDRETNNYFSRLKKAVDVKDDGSFRLDMRYFAYHYKDRMPSRELCDLLGGPVRTEGAELTQRHKDIAAALQLLTEDIVLKLVNSLYDETGCENLVLAGGVGLNSVLNGKILKNTPFKNVWIHPDPGDGGTSAGVAAYLYHTLLKRPRETPLSTAYLGPEFSADEIREFLDGNGIIYSQFENDGDLIGQTAKLIFDDKIVGWFQGRMEWGPRALGSRSILANPINPEMKDILNMKVKHREGFRPFAPVVCEDDALDFFECDVPLPEPTYYMLMVYPVKEKWRQRIPAVTHVDGTGRLQTIRRSQNPLYHDLIKEFGKLSGVPMLINTSYNVRGEPIVCTPSDAYKCMMGTRIDCLVIGRFLIRREDNPGDMWDSETSVRR
ncbi:MAG: carbamoyltransferase [Candidatus Altiarchaeota archaeon]